ncbi:MAG TPA: alpha/beta hydrolase [Burkholderiales bacterium]|nr:alpha/beta hydrolase [Burkholderiales bacterium]
MNHLSIKNAALASCLLAMLTLVPALAKVEPFPASFKVMDVPVGGATIHVRVGGSGPAVLMLHGFGDTGDMWQPLAIVMMKDHTVVVPDLRGMGLSSHPETGYEKKTQAGDMLRVLDVLKIDSIDLVTHDIGNMVGFSLAAQAQERVKRWVVMDAPLPGIGHWTEQLLSPKTWHFSFYGPDEERLVAGRERIYLDRFYNELSADPAHVDEQTRAHYAAIYARPKGMHSAFAQFAAFRQDAIDNPMLLNGGKLSMPVLAIGGEKSYGTSLATEIGFAATDVTALSIPNAGHWLMEEQPGKTVAAIVGFLGKE